MADAYADRGDAVSSQARRLIAVTPSDSTDLADVAKAVYVGTGGDVSIIAAGDTTAVVLKNLLSGSLIPVRAKRVMATGTTATNLVALY